MVKRQLQVLGNKQIAHTGTRKKRLVVRRKEKLAKGRPGGADKAQDLAQLKTAAGGEGGGPTVLHKSRDEHGCHLPCAGSLQGQEVRSWG